MIYVTQGFHDELSKNQVFELYKEARWSRQWTKEKIASATYNSLCFYFFEKRVGIIGLVRVITDYHTISYVCDVIVKKGWRRQRVGTQLMESVLNYQGINRTTVILMTRDAKEFYKRLGFRERTAMVWRKK